LPLSAETIKAELGEPSEEEVESLVSTSMKDYDQVRALIR